MVGIVIVSHSHRIAEGVAELAREMGGPDVRLETAGGLDLPDHPIGTDAVPVAEAGERAWADDVVRDVTNGRGPADAASLNAVATLGATKGHELEIKVTGPQADEAAEALHALAARSFDDRPDLAGPPASPTADAPTAAGEERILR